MSSAIIYTIDGGDRSGALVPDRVEYRLPDGYMLPVLTQDGFCRTCSSLRGVELIYDLDTESCLYTNEDRLAVRALKRGNPNYDRAYVAMRRYEWRQARQSDPRCVICGSQDVFMLVGKRCSDPVTGHTFESVDCEFYTSDVLSWTILDTEGNVLERDIGIFGKL